MRKFNWPIQGLALLLLFSSNFVFAQDLEVELIGKEVNAGIHLLWKIPDDHSITKFTLERSVHDTEFKLLESYEIKELESLSISFFDSRMGMEKVGYRLKFTNEDQSTFFSKKIQIRKKVVNTFRVVDQELLPQGVFKVTLESIVNGEVDFLLKDEIGEVVLKQNWKTKLGLNDYFIDLDYFLDGDFSALIRRGKEYQSLTFNKATRKPSGVATKDSKW